MSRTAIIILVVGVLILGGIGATIFVLNQPQDTRSRAQSFPTPPPTLPVTPTPTLLPTTAAANPSPTGIGGGSTNNDASCAAPSQAQNVLVEYPGCEGDSCLFTQASCMWDPNADAATYNITVTEVETGNVVRNESIPSSTTKILFPITQGRTYKCDVSVANACGSVSAATSDQLLCEADAIIPTATVPPTVPPTTPIASSTPTLIPTTPPTVTPTPPVVGGITPTIGVIGALLLAIIGGIVFLAL